MNSNVFKATEISAVERQYVTNSMRLHKGYNSCVMHLHTGYAMGTDQIAPKVVCCGHVRVSGRKAMEDLHAAIGFLNGESKTASCGEGTGADIPELCGGLRKKAECGVIAPEKTQSLESDDMELIVSVYGAQENV